MKKVLRAKLSIIDAFEHIILHYGKFCYNFNRKKREPAVHEVVKELNDLLSKALQEFEVVFVPKTDVGKPLLEIKTTHEKARNFLIKCAKAVPFIDIWEDSQINIVFEIEEKHKNGAKFPAKEQLEQALSWFRSYANRLKCSEPV